METKKTEKDHSGTIGLGTAGAGAAAGATTVGFLTGGSTAASAIIYALGAVGSVVGGGMAAGLGVLIGGPVALGAAAYGVSKIIRKRKKSKR